MCPWDQTWDASLWPGSELGDYSNKYSLSVTRRSLWSKQTRIWRRSLVRPSVCDAVQETKQFVDCHQSRHWRILQNPSSFEFRENRLNDSSTLPIWVRFSAGDHMHWRLWATVTSSKWVQWLQRKPLSVFSTFSIYFTKRRHRTCARNLLSDCEFRDRRKGTNEFPSALSTSIARFWENSI
jgi:hypothetical protein